MPCLQWRSRAVPKRARAVLPAVVAALVALGSCADEATPDGMTPEAASILVLVNVQGVLADVTSLQVRASLNGKSDPVGLNITNNTSQFAISLPNTPQSLGTLRIDGFGLDSRQCYQASGSVTTQLVAGTNYQELTLALIAVGTRLCQVVVDLNGSGVVTSTPPGITCGGEPSVCSFGFPYGTAVTLSGPLSPQSYPVWSPNCTTTGAQGTSCKITTLGQGEQHVAARFVPRSCSPGGFCQYNPLPSSYSVSGLWGSSAKDVWAIGALPSSIMHYDGNVWTATPNPNLTSLTRIWGSGPSDVWALGGSSLLHYDGTKWATVAVSGLTTFSAGATAGPEDVWVAGDTLQVMRYNGIAWSAAFPITEVWTAMWASSETNLWGLGTSGSIYHYDGQAATKDTSAALLNKTWTSLWGTGPADLWVASATEVGHWDGTTWTAQPIDSGLTLGGVNGGGGYGGPEAFFTATSGRVFRHKGTADCLASRSCWSLAATPAFSGTLRAVWGSSATDLWAAGDFGGLIHFDGTAWRGEPSVGGVNLNLVGVFATAVNVNASPVVAGLGSTQVVSYDNNVGIGTSVSLPSGMTALYGVPSGSSVEIWAVGGASNIYRSTDGKAFTVATAPLPTGGHTVLSGVWMTSSSSPTNRSYLVVGDTGYIARFDGGGTAWTQIMGCPLTANLKSIHGSGSSVFAVGSGGALYSINLTTNTCSVPLTTPPATNYNSVFHDGSVVWLAGEGGVVATYLPTPKTLVPVTSGTTASLTGVWAGGGTNPAWVVGSSGTILSCTATGCTPQQAGLNANFRGVWGANPTDIWVAGNNGTLLRRKQ